MSLENSSGKMELAWTAAGKEVEKKGGGGGGGRGGGRRRGKKRREVETYNPQIRNVDIV